MIYYFGKLLFHYFMRIFCRLHFIDRDKMPKSGSFILASNHVSYYDPLAVGTGYKGTIYYLAKRELFESFATGLAMRILKCIPVNRDGTDIGAIKKAINYLKEGAVVGIFPEGTRSPNGELQKGEHGAARLSLMSGAPIVPAAVIGTWKAKLRSWPFPKYKRAIVKYGDPIYPDSIEGSKKEKIVKITELLMDRIKQLKEELESEWAP